MTLLRPAAQAVVFSAGACRQAHLQLADAMLPQRLMDQGRELQRAADAIRLRPGMHQRATDSLELDVHGEEFALKVDVCPAKPEHFRFPEAGAQRRDGESCAPVAGNGWERLLCAGSAAHFPGNLLPLCRSIWAEGSPMRGTFTPSSSREVDRSLTQCTM